MNRRRLRSCRGDRGAAAIEMPLAVGLLLLPIALVVMIVPQWPERQTVARAAAKDAATVYANALDAESGRAQATSTVSNAASNHGLPPGSMTVEFTGDWCRACTVTAIGHDRHPSRRRAVRRTCRLVHVHSAQLGTDRRLQKPRGGGIGMRSPSLP